MSEDLKQTILSSIRDTATALQVEAALSKIGPCTSGEAINLCARGRNGRGRSPYQDFISTCMKDKKIKGFGEAPKAMRACAADWKKQKGG